MTALVDLSDERLRRDVERLHRNGPRVLFEFLLEIGRERLLRVDLERRVGRYAELDPGAIEALGGDQFPPRGNR
jgi:hypothetical protein